jgi:phosphoglycolate phosphatase
MPTSAKATLLFDLDGTLTDPAIGITRSLQHAMTALGREPIDAEALRHRIGPPLRETFAEILVTDEVALIEQAVAHYRERYFDVGLYENMPYDGVHVMLDTLRARGHGLRVVTSKVLVAARRIVEHFDLARYFDDVHGSELDGRFDDKGELVAHVLTTSGAACASCVMIGDRLYDIRAGRSNGVQTIGVTWGYGSAEELLEAGADALCSSPHDIPAALARLPRIPTTARSGSPEH